MPRFSPFEGLGAKKDDIVKAERAGIAKKFQDVVGGRYNKIANEAFFNSKSVPLMTINLINRETAPGKHSVFAVLDYNVDKNKGNKLVEPKKGETTSRHLTVSISPEGDFLFDRFPAEIAAIANRETISKEILSLIDLLNPRILVESDIEIKADVSPIVKPGGNGPIVESRPRVLDPERIAAIKEHPSVLCILFNKKGGLKKYLIFVTRNALILESEEVGNALYAIKSDVPFTHKLDLTEAEAATLEKEPRLRSLIHNKTRGDIADDQEHFFDRIEHRGQFKEKIKELLDKLNEEYEKIKDKPALLD